MNTTRFAGWHRALGCALVLALANSPFSRPAHAAAPANRPAEEGSEEAEPTPEELEEARKLAEAREAFTRGTELYGQARFEEALEAFLDAQSLYPSPDFHYNIGQCYESLEKYEEAIRAYKSYLRGSPDAQDYASVESKIGRLERVAEEKAKEAAGPSADEQKQAKTSKALVISGAAVIGIGAAGAVATGLAFGLQARSLSQQVEDINAGNNPDELTLAEVENLDARGRRAEVLQIVGVGVGGGVAVVGAILLAVGLKKRPKADDGAQARLAPMLGFKSTGVVLTGRF